MKPPRFPTLELFVQLPTILVKTSKIFILTIDLDIQQYAEQALETELRNRRDLPEDIYNNDSAPHNPRDRFTNFTSRVYGIDLPEGGRLEFPEWVPVS